MSRISVAVAAAVGAALFAVSVTIVPAEATSGGARGALCSWSAVRSPPVPSMSLSAVFANGPADVWIVGQRGEQDAAKTLALHYDGHSLVVVPTPNPVAKANVLHGVVGFGKNDVWAVGGGESHGPSYPLRANMFMPLVLHYDGRTWRSIPTPHVKQPFGGWLYGIDGSDANDVWAVGMGRARWDWVGAIEHWNGKQWSVVPSPQSSFNAVSVLSKTDAWAVGTSADPNGRNLLTAHWNGRRWTLVKDTTRPGSETYANAVSASAANDVWIVGQETVAPFVERFDGSSFERLRVPDADWSRNYDQQKDSYFNDVAVISPEDVWAVGTFGIENYDGRRWHLISRNSSFTAIAASSQTDLWAVGGDTVWHYTCG